MNTYLVVFAAFVATGISGTAAATGSEEIPQRAVSYADLDLNQQLDAAILYRRIGSAARTVCAVRELPPVEAMNQRQRCARQAIARAVAEVDAPLVTRLAANGGTVEQERYLRTALAPRDRSAK